MFLPVPPRPDSHPAAASAEEDADLRAFVGPNARFYLARWRNAADSGTDFNRAAFFLSYFWLAYRRMYGRAFALFGIILAEIVVEDVVFCGLLGAAEPPAILTPIIGFTIAVVCGARGNRWYLAHAREAIAGVRKGNPPQPDARDALAARGGVDFPGAVGAMFLCLLAAVITGTGIAALHFAFRE